jgi:hypothetical protein
MSKIHRVYENLVWKISSWNSGEEIANSELENLWEILREMLGRRGYRVGEIQLPSVKARLVKHSEYVRIAGVVDRLANTRVNTIEEYGESYPTESAIGVLVQPPGKENSYEIFLSKSRWKSDNTSTSQEGSFLQWVFRHICHELLHIWEHQLSVKPAGTLAREIFGDAESRRLLDEELGRFARVTDFENLFQD